MKLHFKRKKIVVIYKIIAIIIIIIFKFSLKIFELKNINKNVGIVNANNVIKVGLNEQGPKIHNPLHGKKLSPSQSSKYKIN